MERAELKDCRTQINHYDAEGLRHEMEENGRRVKFLFNMDKEIVAEENEGTIIRYIWDLGLISSDSENAKTYYHYACDEMGSITHVVSEAVTGSAGTRILNHYEYDAFGNTIVCEESVPNRFRYTGQQYDPVTAQYYLRARYYNPVVGRFLQEDTYYGDGLNLFSYCHNNPLMYYDPSGNAGRVCDDKYRQWKKFKDKGNSPQEALQKTNDYRQWKKYKDAGMTPEQAWKAVKGGYYQDSTGRWHRSNGKYASNAELGLPTKPKTSGGNGKNNTWQYKKQWHDKRMNEVFDNPAEGKKAKGKENNKYFRRYYDFEYEEGGVMYDGEFKSSNFPKRPRTESELKHIQRQIERDIILKDTGEAKPLAF